MVKDIIDTDFSLDIGNVTTIGNKDDVEKCMFWSWVMSCTEIAFYLLVALSIIILMAWYGME